MTITPQQSTALQVKGTLSLASIFGIRMLGLFIILPIFALYTHQLPGATPNLMGIALGIYGLTQAIFQIPLAMLSDKIGRKPVMLIGLIVFVLGSIVAALSGSIEGIIIGRALQGAGAIGSTTIALAADLTTIKNRTKAMAVIGMTIGASFAIAMVISPLLDQWVGLSGIFWTTAMLGILSIGLLVLFVPASPKLNVHPHTQTATQFTKHVILNPALLRLNFGIFSLHALLTASFVVVPILLANTHALPKEDIWQVYLSVLLVAFIVMVPCIIVAEKFHRVKLFFSVAILALAISQLLLWHFHDSVLKIGLVLALFFTAFTFLESTLPSLISKTAPAQNRGAALGVYSTLQFLGIFAGGSAGGWLYYAYGLSGIFLASSVLMGVWFCIALTSANEYTAHHGGNKP
ncbi:MAG: Transporter, superfamily [Gammaproteobacteria bacterium]|nr:Transporter, superfamily [Gammaproteobacteria bacterium]